MLTLLEALLIGAASVLVLLLLVEALAHIGGHKSFVTTVILGEDNRTSTSKTFIFMWTLLVAWALATLLIAGQIINTHGCVLAKAAIAACTARKDQIGLLQTGWHNFLSGGLSGAYLVLLGIPAAAGVAAKAITQSKNSAGTLTKTTAPNRQKLTERLAQIFSADDRTTDLGDLQYVIFNLVTAVYFVTQFVKPATDGLPHLPATLLGLTSVSAALYVGKKAATRNRPAITGVFPSILRPDQRVTIVGSGLTANPVRRLPAAAQAVDPQVRINGMPARNVLADRNVADRLTAVVPNDLVRAGEQTPVYGTIEVLSADGAVTPGFQVQLDR